MVKLALISGVRRRTVLACVAAIVLAIIAVDLAILSASGRRTSLTPAKAFSLSRLGAPGQQVTLSHEAGRPVIVNFFASWCTPCRKETPLLAGFYLAHRGKVLIIGVDSNDQSAAALRFLRQHKVTYPVGFDPSASVAVRYGVAALPQTFFLNSSHQIVRHVVGAVTKPELTSWAASLAGGNGAG